MIFGGDNKTKMLFLGKDRVYTLCLGKEVLYNCYAIPRETVVWVNNEGTEGDNSVFSNTQWIMK